MHLMDRNRQHSCEPNETERESIERRLRRVEDVLIALTQAIAPRVDRTQLAERFGIHRNTLRTRLAKDRTFPRPCADGRWLLSEVIEWELRGVRGNR